MMATDSRDVAPILWLLLLAFTLRVAGQVVVVLFEPTWLPPMEAWMSGLLPYRFLFAAQILIIGLYLRICLDFTRRAGWFVRPRPAFARGLLLFAYVYFAVMLPRFGARFVPATAWLGEWIPALFHLVLASFLIVVARWHRGELGAMERVPEARREEAAPRPT